MGTGATVDTQKKTATMIMAGPAAAAQRAPGGLFPVSGQQASTLRDFGTVLLGDNAALSCPVATPLTCPFGGACHTCPTRVQAKVEVGQPDDEHEREADRLAEQVMRMSEPQAQRKACLARKEDRPVQTKPTDAGDVRAHVDHPLIQSVLSSPGQPLDAAARSSMEPRFGQDLGGVRVHVGSEAAESARALNARAYTVGRNVVFGEGQYAPESGEGRRLTAHELAHVLRHRGRGDRIHRWSKSGVQDELCPSRDRWVVMKVDSMDVFEFARIERHWDTYNKTAAGGKGAYAKRVSYEVDGLADPAALPPNVYIRKAQSDKEAAATCFHEVTHTGQPAAMAQLNAEYDAWIQEEYFRLRHGAPEAIKGATFKAGGILVTDVNLVKKEVRGMYQHRDPSSPFVWEFDKQVESGVKQVSGWACPAATTGIPAHHNKPPVAVIKASASPRLRAIHTSGPYRGYVYLTTQALAGGTRVTVLQDAVNRIDYDKTFKTMVEILHNEANYWVPASDIQYP